MSKPSRSAAERAHLGTPLDDVNDRFHAAYDSAREESKLDAPVFVVLGDSLILFRDDERRELSFSSPIFHLIKSAAHAPVGLYAALHRLGGSALEAKARKQVVGFREKIKTSLGSLEKAEASARPGGLTTARALLTASLEHAEHVLETGAVEERELAQFASRQGPLLLQSTREATRFRLDALNEQVAKILQQLSENERGTFHVVVAGDHQARSRSLGMQYFQKLLRGAPDADQRLAYAESVETEEEALALVGTQRLDRAIATAFFDDPKRLQQDVLGDAVEEQLGGLALPSL